MSPLHQEWREWFSDKDLQSSAVNFPCNWGCLRDHIIELYNLQKHQIIHIFNVAGHVWACTEPICRHVHTVRYDAYFNPNCSVSRLYIYRASWVISDVGPRVIIGRCWEFNMNWGFSCAAFQASHCCILRAHGKRAARWVMFWYFYFYFWDKRQTQPTPKWIPQKRKTCPHRGDASNVLVWFIVHYIFVFLRQLKPFYFSAENNLASPWHVGKSWYTLLGCIQWNHNTPRGVNNLNMFNWRPH